MPVLQDLGPLQARIRSRPGYLGTRVWHGMPTHPPVCFRAHSYTCSTRVRCTRVPGVGIPTGSGIVLEFALGSGPQLT
eukprot:1525097-Rhodomonas_salina.3